MKLAGVRLPPGHHQGVIESAEVRGHAIVVRYQIDEMPTPIEMALYPVDACRARTSRGRVCGRPGCRAHRRQLE